MDMTQLKEHFGNVLSERKRKDLGKLEQDLKREGMKDSKLAKMNDFITQVRKEEANNGGPIGGVR